MRELKNKLPLVAMISAVVLGCTHAPNEETWVVDSQEDWQAFVADNSNIEIIKVKVVPTDSIATLKSSVKLI